MNVKVLYANFRHEKDGNVEWKTIECKVIDEKPHYATEVTLSFYLQLTLPVSRPSVFNP